VGRWVDIEADDILEFLSKPRIVRQLKRADAMQSDWCASRIRCTERRLTPVAFASMRPVQWVVAPGDVIGGKFSQFFETLAEKSGESAGF
jgi:hypothetical protein